MSLHPPVALVVDDDGDLRWLTRRVLERVGFRVVEAADGSEALALLRTVSPSALVTDLMMPGLGGDELLARADEQGLLEGVAVLLLSGSSHLAPGIACEKQSKPMRPEALLDFARRALLPRSATRIRAAVAHRSAKAS
jgi:CheY-like chemotaxis protein